MNRTFYAVAAVILVLTLAILEALDTTPSAPQSAGHTSPAASDDNAGLKNLRIP